MKTFPGLRFFAIFAVTNSGVWVANRSASTFA
jgi:hypothetical protein